MIVIYTWEENVYFSKTAAAILTVEIFFASNARRRYIKQETNLSGDEHFCTIFGA